MGKRYIVTGGAGFVGSHVADQLVEAGHDVYVVDNLQNGKRENVHKGATLHEVDIRDFEKLAPLFKGAEGVFHLAAQPRMQLSIREPRLTNDINITGTLNVLLAARDAGVPRVVYSASSSAYGEGHPMPLKEEYEARPIIPYAIQKRVGEQYCQMVAKFYGLETVSLRYFNVYGPRQTTDADGPYATVIGIFLGLRAKGKPMTVVPDGNQRRDFTHVSDIARGNILAMGSKKVGRGEIVNLGTGRNHSVLEVAGLVGGQWEFCAPREGEVRETLADNARARELLGWTPAVSLEDGIAELKKAYML